MGRPTIYTIGHSTRGLAEFVALLSSYGAEVLVDVRRFPVSRRFPHFDRDALAPALAAAGIRYLWLGEYLGGYRRDGYKQWMQSDEFRRGLVFLEAIAWRRTVVVMCAELLYFRCHRRFIADALVARGWPVVHVFDGSRRQPHRRPPDQPSLPIDA